MKNASTLSALGVEFWNDSCAVNELTEAISNGASGATSNPVIVNTVLRADPEGSSRRVRELMIENPTWSEDDIAWALVKEATLRGANVLRGRGLISAQTNPKLYRDAEGMFRHGLELSTIAENISIKVPTTQAGVEALGRLAARGISTNATVCFTVPQALAVAQAMPTASTSGPKAPPYITIMVGRLDDHLKRVAEAQKIPVDPAVLDQAGIAVVKKAFAEFKARGYTSRLLVAAYRHPGHWKELISPHITQTIPFTWWKKFLHEEQPTTATLDVPVTPRVVSELLEKFPDFRKAYDVDGLAPREFDTFGPTVHTLTQFLNGYQSLVELVREAMFALRGRL
jgi:transaldolase